MFTLEDVLQTWDQAGERPYEVLEKENMLEFLLCQLNNSSFYLNGASLYRGSSRNQELNVGDVKRFEYPSSWTYEEEMAKNFVDGCKNRVIFVLSGDRCFNALENSYNSYEEEEVIIAPFEVTIISKTIINGIIYLGVK